MDKKDVSNEENNCDKLLLFYVHFLNLFTDVIFCHYWIKRERRIFIFCLYKQKSTDTYIIMYYFTIAFTVSFHTQIVRPINAFLIVDVQNDFISGSLNISNCSAQQNGIEVSSFV